MSGGGAQLLQEVTLDDDYREQEKYDNLADMFAIIRTLQFLELAHSRQNIKQADYEQECNMLLSNFKTARIQNGGDSFSVDDFVQTYNMDCPTAVARLKIGINAVQQYGAGVQTGGDSKAKIASDLTVQFTEVITYLETGESSKEAIKPQLTKLLDKMHKVTDLPPSFQGKKVVIKWLEKYEKMGALDELDEGEVADLDLEIKEALDEFRTML